MGVSYTTRETVKSAVDVKDSARANVQIDRLMEDASRSVDKLCHRVTGGFAPTIATRRFDWPDLDQPTPWRLWLGRHRLLSLTSMTSGGIAVDSASVLTYPTEGPPYSWIELDRSTTSGFDSGPTSQNSIVIAGLWGESNNEQASVTTITEDLDASETAVDVASSRYIGVGSILRCDNERMLVTDKVAIDTGIDLAAPGMAAQMNVTTVPLSTATGAPQPDEMIIIDGERMLVVDLIGTNAYVVRMFDGTPLAAHTAGTGIFAYRTLTVERGALGTTATTHTSGTAVHRTKIEPSIQGLATAETLNLLAQENSAYARVVGQGEGQREARGAGLADKRQQVYNGYALMGRTGAI